MKKKIISVIFCAVLCFGMPVGCSNKTDDSEGTKNQGEETEVSSKEDAAAILDSSEAQIKLDREKVYY